MIIDDAGTHDAEQHGSDNGESDYDLSNDDSDAIDNDSDHFSSHSESDSDESEITASDGSDSEDFLDVIDESDVEELETETKKPFKEIKSRDGNSKKASLMKGFVSVSKTKKDVASVPSKKTVSSEMKSKSLFHREKKRARDNKKHSSDSHAKKPSRPSSGTQKKSPEESAESERQLCVEIGEPVLCALQGGVKGAKNEPLIVCGGNTTSCILNDGQPAPKCTEKQVKEQIKFEGKAFNDMVNAVFIPPEVIGEAYDKDNSRNKGIVMSGFLIKRTTQSKTASKKAGPSAEIKGMCNYLFFPCTATFELELYRNEYSIPEGGQTQAKYAQIIDAKNIRCDNASSTFEFPPKSNKSWTYDPVWLSTKGFDHIVSSNKRSIIKAAEKKVAPPQKPIPPFPTEKKQSTLKRPLQDAATPAPPKKTKTVQLNTPEPPKKILAQTAPKPPPKIQAKTVSEPPQKIQARSDSKRHMALEVLTELTGERKETRIVAGDDLFVITRHKIDRKIVTCV